MALYLVQHGKVLSKEQNPERPLSDEGIADVDRIAQVAASYRVRVGRIRHSGKPRARQTAEMMAAHLLPNRGPEQGAGLDPLDDVMPLAQAVRSEEFLMVVGHLPFLDRLTSYLVTGSAERPVFAFQNGGIVCLDTRGESGGWIIRWALMPQIG